MAKRRKQAATIVMGCLLGCVPAQAEPALSYPIAGTNQTTYFDNTGPIGAEAAHSEFPGQNADYPGNKPAYRDNGDGTVTDLVTGLVWEKSYRELDWSEAEEAARNATTGGFTDWRVPTVKDLYSLIEFSGNQGRADPSDTVPPPDAKPFIDTVAFDFAYPGKGRYIDVQFVTSTVYAASVMEGQRCFFGVNFADGRIKCYPLSRPGGRASWYGRFVRGNPAYGKNRFAANGDGTVSDKATGLMWTSVDTGDPSLGAPSSGPSPGALTWQEALQFAQGTSYAGHDDWRLPDAKELQSIVDYSRSPDTTHSAAIDPVFSVTRIANAAGEEDYPAFWTSTSFEPGRDAVVIYFGRALGYFAPPGQSTKRFMDVHGAGSQRTDPKTGNDSYGHGPQGDVRSVRNFVRLVRDNP